MLRRVIFFLNLIRGIPAYLAVHLCGAADILRQETDGYTWFIEGAQYHSFFSRFHWLLCRYPVFRSHVVYRCAQRSAAMSYVVRILFPPKKDLEIDGDIGTGLVIYHGHGVVLAPHKVGRNLAVYQGVTIGRNVREGRTVHNPIIGDNVTIYTNAVVAGGIVIGDNVSIGAGAVVMKDVPANSIVTGNPCVIRSKELVSQS